jgi:ubiquinone/menaquinone biosynthesis C-methylase UbiE
MESAGYQQAWVRPSTLDGLNRRIHDGVPIEDLALRAADRRDTFFELLFPYARPTAGSRVLELGQGVGWIMEAVLAQYPVSEIVGLDVSPVMIQSAQERWDDPRARYVLYDGLHVPLEDDAFDNVYSVACIQHIEKHHAFLAMQELVRILKPGGHGTLHLMSVHHLPASPRSYAEECWNHVNNVDAHWMHYYSYDELFMLFSHALGVTDLDIKYYRTSFWVHFSKGTDTPFKSPEVEQAYFLNRDLPAAIRPRGINTSPSTVGD